MKPEWSDSCLNSTMPFPFNDFMKDKFSANDRSDFQLDPLQETYHESIAENPFHLKSLEARDAALLTIDMQYLDAAPGFGVFSDAHKSGVPLEAQEYYFKRLKDVVIPNVSRLQKTFRQHQLEVIHTRIQSMTKDGRDRGAGHKRLGLHAAPGSKEAEFLPEVAPYGDEIIINKTSSGVFPTTNLYYILKNIGVRALFVTGVYTNECVSSTIREACDLGFHVSLIEDSCATVTADLHNFTVETLRDRYCRVISTQEAIDEIATHVSSQKIRDVAEFVPEDRLYRAADSAKSG
ncbi:MAG: cysteine hydrolase [Opitutales bacterium]|nr:cysteine hydrolase [Opitutales bacterium]